MQIKVTIDKIPVAKDSCLIVWCDSKDILFWLCVFVIIIHGFSDIFDLVKSSNLIRCNVSLAISSC